MPAAPVVPAADKLLPAVQVNGKAKIEQSRLDRKIYRVGDDVQALTGSAAEILNKLPSVEVDADGNLSLRGAGNVTLLIDGKPSSALTGSKAGDALLQIPAGDIERIEVMTHPPAQYGASGTGGVINIVTKKNRRAGASGALQLSAGNDERGQLALNGAYGAEAINISAGLGLKQDTRQRDVRSLQLSPGSLTADATQSSGILDEHVKRLIPSMKLGADLRIDERRSVSATFSVRQRDGDRFFDQSSSTQAVSASGPSAASTRHSDGHEWSRNEEQGLRLKQSFPDPDDTMEVSLSRSVERERERYAYTDLSLLPVSAVRHDSLFLNHDLSSRDFGLDYSHAPAQGPTLKAGLALQLVDNGFDNSGDTLDPVTGRVVPSPDLTNQFRYRQRVEAAYVSWQQDLDAWALLAGMRAERTRSRGDQLSTGVSNRQQYTGFYPSVRLQRSIDDEHTWTLGYSKRLQRPDGEALNPFVDHQDIHNLRAGNANLLPQETQSVELGYRIEQGKQTSSITAYVRENRNSVTSVTQLLSPDVSLSTLGNLPLSRAAGLEFGLERSLAPSLSARVSGNLFHTEIDASGLGFVGLRSTTGINLKSSLDWRSTASDTVQLSFSRADKRLTPQGSIAAINLVNVGYRHQIEPNLSAFVTLSDLFNGQRFVRVLNTPQFSQTYKRVQPGRVAFIGLNYGFGTSKKGKAQPFEFDSGG